MLKLVLVTLLLISCCLAKEVKQDEERRVFKRSLKPRKPLGVCSTDKSQVQCHSSTKCIPKYWQCDNIKDCNDNSDEDCVSEPDSSKHNSGIQPSPTSSYCPYWKFKCNNGQCIYSSQKCNGYTDCYDGSDESNCPVSSAAPQPSPTTSHCPYWKFKCNNGQCIYKSWKCDGHSDCSDGSDESNCPVSSAAPQPSVK